MKGAAGELGVEPDAEKLGEQIGRRRAADFAGFVGTGQHKIALRGGR